MNHAPEFSLLRSSVLIGAEVSNIQGETLGHARELLLIMKTGRVQYVVLETVSAQNSAGHVLVPWPSLKWNQERECLVLDITADRLAKAPSFDPSSSSDWQDADWRQTVDRYYGLEPEWEKPENYTG